MVNKTKIDEVVKELQRRIVEGTYQAGERLPAERALAEELGVSRQTLRTALLRLYANNLIETRRTAGIFVRAPGAKIVIGPTAPAAQKTHDASLLTAARQMRQHEVQCRFIEPTAMVRADQELARKLEVEVGTDVVHVSQLYLVNQVPYRMVESYAVAPFLPSLGTELPVREQPAQVTPQPGEQHAFDQPVGERLVDAKQAASPYAFERFQCRMPSPHEAELLRIGRNQPLIELERWAWLRNHTLVEYTHVVANALLHEYTYAYDDGDKHEALLQKINAGS